MGSWARTSPLPASYLLGLPVGTRLRIGDAQIEITGLRNPCAQIEQFREGLLSQVVYKDAHGEIVRKAGVMGVVVAGGVVRPGQGIATTLPPLPHKRLERVDEYENPARGGHSLTIDCRGRRAAQDLSRSPPARVPAAVLYI